MAERKEGSSGGERNIHIFWVVMISVRQSNHSALPFWYRSQAPVSCTTESTSTTSSSPNCWCSERSEVLRPALMWISHAMGSAMSRYSIQALIQWMRAPLAIRQHTLPANWHRTHTMPATTTNSPHRNNRKCPAIPWTMKQSTRWRPT